VGYEPTGLVVGKFAPFHNGHKLVIDTALKDMDVVIVLVYANPDFADMPVHARANWIREIYKNLPVYVYIPQNPPPDTADDFTQREFVKTWLEAHRTELPFGSKRWIDVVYGSDAYIPGFAAHIGASPRVVDAHREQFPVSGTAVRAITRQLEKTATVYTHDETVYALDENVYAHWDSELLYRLQRLVPKVVHGSLQFWMRPVKSVVFLGAESTGKSTLAERMALEYDTVFVPEYGREVWEAKNGQLELADYVQIAHRHRKLEAEAAQRAKRYLFVDTNAITTMFLGYAYEGDGLPELTELAKDAETRYHRVFVCADDIPFEQDGWRDDAVWRSRAQRLVRYDLAVRGVPYTMVTGSLEHRVSQVKTALESRLEPDSRLSQARD
jgi:HTH-type transcriptional regulator, transcriptional repressor of NAD biosynthesis genes